jgi:hypothetical protein
MFFNIWIIGAAVSAIMFFAWYVSIPPERTKSNKNTDDDDLSESGKIFPQIKTMLTVGLVVLFCLAWCALSWATVLTMLCDGDLRRDMVRGFRTMGRIIQRGLSQMLNDKN